MKNKKKILIIALVIFIIIAVVAAGCIFYFTNNEDKEKKNEKLEWGDVYLKVLDDDEFEELDDMEIQLCDLDEDSIPELIVYGLRDLTNYIANIYKINEDNEVDTIKVDLQEKVNMEYLYSVKDDKYSWYAVTENETTNEKTVYDIDIKNKDSKPTKVSESYENDFVEVDDKISQKVPLSKEAESSEKKDAFNKAKENYVPTTEMVTDSVKEKVENAKLLNGIEKTDSSKALVYSGLEIKPGQYHGVYRYPIININSNDVKTINSEIYENYGFTQKEYDEYGFCIGPETEEITYKYYINGNILSVIPYDGGNSSVWANSYNIDLKTLNKMSSDELIQYKGLNKDDIISKAKEIATQEFDKVINKDKAEFQAYGNWEMTYPTKDLTEWKTESEKDITTLENVYLDENGDFCILFEIRHPGGQWSCTKTMIINVSKNYSTSELSLEFSWDNVVTQNNTNTNTNNTTTNSSNTTTQTSSSPVESTSSDKPTDPNAISQDEALKLAQKTWGTEATETNYEIRYGYAGWGKDSRRKTILYF